MTLRTRTLFVNQYFPPDEAATAQILGDVVSGGAERIESRVITSNRSYVEPKRTHADREEWHGARVERVPITSFGRGSKIGRAIDYTTFLLHAAGRLLVGPKPEVIVGLSSPPILGALAVAVARLRGAGSVYWVMDVYPDLAGELGMLQRGDVAYRVLASISRWTLRKADLVVALGEDMAVRLKENGARNLVVIRNWADGEGIRPKATQDCRLRKTQGWQGRFVVLYSGNLGLAHEFETALAAAERLQDRPEILFVFVGHGPRLAEVKRFIEEKRLRNVVILPPVAREELGDSLAVGDVHLITLRPGMPGLVVPSKLYGSLAAGRPVVYVGPSEGEVFETVQRGCGAAVLNGAVDELVRVLCRYLEEPSLRAEHGMRAREVFEADASQAKQVGRFLTAIEGVAASMVRTRMPSAVV